MAARDPYALLKDLEAVGAFQRAPLRGTRHTVDVGEFVEAELPEWDARDARVATRDDYPYRTSYCVVPAGPTTTLMARVRPTQGIGLVARSTRLCATRIG